MIDNEDFATTTTTSTIESLLSAKKDIRLTLHRNHAQLQLLRSSHSVSVSTVLDFADNITISNKAMSGWVEGMPLGKSNPPAPQPEQMRDSCLQKHHREQNSVIRVHSAAPHIDEVNNLNINVLLEKLIKQRSKTSLSNQEEIGIMKDDEEYSNSGSFEDGQENKRARKFNITFDIDSDDD